MKYFYLIETTKGEYASSYDYITDTFEDARAHVKDFCDWYTPDGTCTLIKVDQNFNELKCWRYWEDKLQPSRFKYEDYEKEDHD